MYNKALVAQQKQGPKPPKKQCPHNKKLKNGPNPTHYSHIPNVDIEAKIKGNKFDFQPLYIWWGI